MSRLGYWTGDGASHGSKARRSLYSLDTILAFICRWLFRKLSIKLDTLIALDFNPSQYRDYQRLKHASLKTFIDAGLSVWPQAATLLGIPTPTPGQPTRSAATNW